jgi:hypothetical protein
MSHEVVHSPNTKSTHLWRVTHNPYPPRAQLRSRPRSSNRDLPPTDAFVLVHVRKGVTMRACFGGVQPSCLPADDFRLWPVCHQLVSFSSFPGSFVPAL